MTGDARAPVDPARSDPTAPPLRLFAAPPAIRRGRFLGLLMLVNWGVMGIYVISQGARSLVGGLAFLLGLVALVAGLANLRAARAAAVTPLIEVDHERLSYRRFSSTTSSTVALAEVDRVVARADDELTLRTRSGERVAVPWSAISDPDRERLVARLGGIEEG